MIFLLSTLDLILTYLINTSVIKFLFLKRKFRNDVFLAVKYYYRNGYIALIKDNPELWGVEINNSKITFLEKFDIFFPSPDSSFTGCSDYHYFGLNRNSLDIMNICVNSDTLGFAVTLYALERAFEDSGLLSKHLLADQIKALNYYIELREDSEIVLSIIEWIKMDNASLYLSDDNFSWNDSIHD